MDTRRTVVIGLISLCALGGTAAFAAPMCPTGVSLAMYTQPGFTCTEDNGILTFKNFVYTPPAGGLNASQITVTPLDKPDSVGFLISGSFANIQGLSTTYVLSYFIDPLPPIIHGEQLDLDPFGSVSLLEDLCTTAFPCAPGNSLGSLNATTGNPMSSTPLAPTNALGIRDTLTLSSPGANSQGFDNVTFVAPEPSSVLLAASGLLGLLAFRARAKLRKIFF